jgi:hypothetical protein
MNSSTAIDRIQPEFVEQFPANLEPGILYVSIRFSTTAHLCACGCGRQVIAPLNPRRYRMTYDGERVSLKPSIGNWYFPCKSHYWIRKNKIDWSWTFSDSEIEGAQEIHDRRLEGLSEE